MAILTKATQFAEGVGREVYETHANLRAVQMFQKWPKNVTIEESSGCPSSSSPKKNIAGVRAAVMRNR